MADLAGDDAQYMAMIIVESDCCGILAKQESGIYFQTPVYADFMYKIRSGAWASCLRNVSG